MFGVGELRVKETDRIQAMATGLAASGVAVETTEDTMTVKGGAVAGGARIASELDHRIAMAFLELGMASDAPVVVDDVSPSRTSFPNFFPLMESLGARFEAAGS